jgi:parallel beta-helix repeat protein
VNRNDPVISFILLSVFIVGLSLIILGVLWSSGSPSPSATAQSDGLSSGSDPVFDPFGFISILKENPFIKKIIELFVPPDEEPGVVTPVPTTPTLPTTPAPTPAPPASIIISIEGGTVSARNADGDLIQSGRAGTDDASVIQTAIDTAPDGGVVEIQEGTYAIASKISSTKSVSIRGVGMPTMESTVKASALSFCGPYRKVYRFGGDVNAGDTRVTVVGASSIQPGDLVLIYDDTIWNPNDSGQYKSIKTGELHRVLNVNGNTVILEDPLVNSYSSSKNGAVQHITPITVTIEGIKIIAPDKTGDYSGISIGYAVDSIIKDCIIENAGKRAIYLRDCYGTTVDHNQIRGCEAAGYGYGVCIACSSAYTWIVNNEIDLCRHTITHGALPAIPGVPRETHIESNFLRASISHTVDAHPCAESMYIENNELLNTDPKHSLVNSGAKLTVIRGNTFSGANGIFKRGAVEGCTFIISDNTFEGVSTCVNTGGAGSVAYLEFTDNLCNNVQDHMCEVFNTGEILIRGNACNGASGDGAIYVEKAKKGTIESNTLNNCYTYCITLMDSTDVKIIDNVCTNANRCGDGSKENVPICLNNSLNILVENNHCYDDTSVESAYWIAEVGASNNNIIRNNKFRGEAVQGTIHTVGKNTIVENNKMS